jgi:hypothetical protein
MKYRKLRIAWSVGCGILCLLLIVAGFALQHRGANVELVQRSGPGLTSVWIYKDKLSLSFEPRVPYRPDWAGQLNRHGFRYTIYSNGNWHVWGPLWAVGVMLVPVGALPWLHYRFSLRTLLITTTLVAVGLGLLVMMVRGN